MNLNTGGRTSGAPRGHVLAQLVPPWPIISAQHLEHAVNGVKKKYKKLP